jgi:putative NADPH-quinone reductase
MLNGCVMCILIIGGHPDSDRNHFIHAAADAYAEGAATLHEVRRIDVSKLDFPLIRSEADWKEGAVPMAIAKAQEALRWAEHVVIFYPLWLGDVPALLKGFLEQVARPEFGFRYTDRLSSKAAEGPIGEGCRLHGNAGALLPAHLPRPQCEKPETQCPGLCGFPPGTCCDYRLHCK